MKPFSNRAPLSPARARNCLLLNQFATPGLGSLIGRRLVAGSGQLLFSVVGFLLFCAWFLDVISQFYGMIDSNVAPALHPWLAVSGLGTFAFAWLWAWFTSFSLLREAKRNESEGKLFDLPPVLPRA